MLSLYPQSYRGRFEQPMEQAFDDLCVEREALGRPMAAFLLRTFMETFIGICRQRWSDTTMSAIASNPRAAALVALILALPLAAVFAVDAFEVRPLDGLLKTALTGNEGRMNALGLMVIGGGMLLQPVALAICLRPVWRHRGEGVCRIPWANLALAGMIAALMVTLWSGFLTDVVRCEIMRVPNCD